MNCEAQAQCSSDEGLADAYTRTDSQVSERTSREVSRSQRNILEWNSYLPEECVATMIAMGWDLTT